MSVQAPTADQMAVRADSLSWAWSLGGVISIGLVYGLVYACMRLSISHNLPQDDVTANILAQTFEPGYVVRQPPLYEWLLWSVQRLTGPTLPSFLIIKYGLLTATFAFLYLVATRIFADRRWTVIAALSPLLLYQIGWNLHEGVTHTMALICAVAASMWAFMRLVERGRIGDYLLFGLIVGLGLISKYTFAAFLFILLASALLQPALRARLCNWRMLASMAAGAAVTAPVLYWLIAGRQDLVALYGTAVAPMADTNRLTAMAIGLGKSVYAPLAFLFPLDVILLVLFPGMLREARGAIAQGVSPRAWDRSKADWPLLLLHITLGGFLVLIFGAIFTGATHYLERYMHPFFLLTTLWLLALVERSGNASRKVLVLTAVLVSVTVLVVPLRLGNLLRAMRPDCEKCRIAVPYDGLAAALEARGFHSGTIIAVDRHDAGNLRRLFPDARIVCLGRPSYAPPIRATDLSSKVAVVWRKQDAKPLPKDAARELARIAGGVAVTPERLRIRWQPYPSTAAERIWEWTVVVADPAPSPRG
jgi:4-amino-4-deoxy-L-arabinose transferase-like glycosyltransferase